MNKIYTMKCNECGVVLPESKMNMLAEDAAQCPTCFYGENTKCDYCKEFSLNEHIQEVNISNELYDLCEWCFDNEDWSTSFSKNNLNEEYGYDEEEEEVNYYTRNSDVSYNHSESVDDEEEEIEEEEEEIPRYPVTEAYSDSDDLDLEESVGVVIVVEDFYKDLINHK